jgi:uncharacterized protein
MPDGKPAGMRCAQLDEENRCKIFGKPERPAFCGSLQPSLEMCGTDDLENPREHAINWLNHLELATQPRI